MPHGSYNMKTLLKSFIKISSGIFFSFLFSSAVYSSTYVMDSNLHPFPSPLPSVVAGGSYVDSSFGTIVTRITDVKGGNPAGLTSNGITNEYARFDPDNSDGTLLILRGTNATWFIYNAKTNAFIKKISLAGDIEPRWHATDPDIFFYVKGPRFYQYHVSTDTSDLLYDFTTDYPTATIVSGKGESDGSLNSKYWAFVVSSGSGDLDWVTFDATTKSIIASYKNVTGLNPTNTNTVTMSMTGDYVLVETDPTQVCNRDWTNCHNLGTASRGHGDLALSADGRDMFVSQNSSTDWIDGVYLDTGESINIKKIDFSTANYTGLHISGNNASTPGWVLISTYGSGDATAWSDGALYMQELAPNGRHWLIAHTNAQLAGGGKDYWAEAFAAINREGTAVYWGSNWGITGQNYADVYKASLPSTWFSDLSPGAPAGDTTPPAVPGTPTVTYTP